MLLVQHKDEHPAGSPAMLEEFLRQSNLSLRIETHAIERRSRKSASHLILNPA